MSRCLFLTAILIVVSIVANANAAPQSTAFTYQGSMNASGQPANGNLDMSFALYDAGTNGNQVGSTLSILQVPVVQGLFSVDLDFPGAFGSSQRWLQVTVGGQVLTPRQAVNAAPVAQYALTGSTTGQGVFEVYGTAQLVVTAATTSYTLIPGLTQTINIPTGAIAYVHTDGGVQSTGATSSTFSVVDIGIFVDGVVSSSGGQRRLSIANTTALAQLIANWSIDRAYALSAGSHTFEVKAVSGAAGSSTANVSSGSAAQLKGVLSVTLINP
ncbi:MAG: hypothetical protein ABI451_02270 [Dokdonella sp.]